jgi:hypothetical protein
MEANYHVLVCNSGLVRNLFRAIVVLALWLGDGGHALGQVDSTATVTIYRPKVKLYGRAVHPVIYCNGSRLAALPAGRFFTIQVKAGHYNLDVDDTQLGFDAHAGETHYLVLGFKIGALTSSGKLVLVTSERGKADTSRLESLETSPGTCGPGS